MRVGCVICSDVFVSFIDVATISCGHTFHVQCILQWIENSKSCPTCRQKATSKNVQKLFFDSTGPSDTQVDPDSLQNKIDSLKFQVVEKDQILRNYKEENEKLKKQTKQLRDEVIQLEKGTKEKDITICAFREQTKHLEALVKRASKAEEEAQEAKSQLKLMKQVKMLLDENSSEIEDTIICNSSGSNNMENIKTLSTIACVLKSRMNKLLEEKRKCCDENSVLASKLREMKKSLHKSEDELLQLKKDYDIKKEDVEALERENSSLQKKISKLQEAIVSPSADVKNSVIQRLISESPIPLEFKKRSKDESDILSLTPEITRKILRNSPIKCDSSISSGSMPWVGSKASYLQVKSAPITACIGDVKPSAYSIFKEGRLRADRLSVAPKAFARIPVYPDDDFGYDGLGGHHKVDYFPNPNQAKVNPLKKKPKKSVRVVTNKGSSEIKKDYFKNCFAEDF